MSGETPSAPFHYRRTQSDQLAEGPDKIAEELSADDYLVGRARHEPPAAEPLINPTVKGFQYDRTDADMLAADKAERVSDSAWLNHRDER